MKTITNGFKEQIAKLGREIDCKFSLHTNDKLITENGKFLMTQANQHLVVEQFDDTEVDEVINAENIYSVSIVTRGNLLSTMMKELDFELSHDLRIGDIIDCEFGVKVNGSYEYVNYGSYMVYSKEFNEDTKTYNYVAYDRMLLTMQEANPEFLSNLEEQTLANCIHTICDTVGLNFTATQEQLTAYPNLSKEINEGTFTDLQITYRDVLDTICQALGLSMIVNSKDLILKTLNDTPVDTFNEQYLKDTNVSFGEKYGKVNSVVLSRSEDTDNIYRRDEESIAENGLCEYKIKDNLIMLYNDREDYIDEIFNQLNGLEYYVTDFNSTGITYLDWLDFYNITVGDKTYKCLMLNDEIKIEQGLEESIYCEEPEETVTPYKTSSKTDKEVSFIVDKQNGKINAKVSQDDIIASLNVAIEDGQGIVNLKGNTVTIDSDKFVLDADGKITATAGDIGGFNMDSTSFSKTLNGIYNYTIQDAVLVLNIGQGYMQNTDIDYVLDYNNDGIVDIFDGSKIIAIITRGDTNEKVVTGTFEIKSNDPKNCLVFKNNNGRVTTSIGVGGINTDYLSASNFACGTFNIGESGFGGCLINGEDGTLVIKTYESNGAYTRIEPGKITLYDGQGHTKTITATS